MIKLTIGQRIKNRRIELGLSVDELAAKLGKNRATIYRYEKNDIKDLPITILDPLAKALETTTAYLMGIDESSTNCVSDYSSYISNDSIVFEITGRSLQYSPTMYEALLDWAKGMTEDSNSSPALYSPKGKNDFKTFYEILKSSDLTYDEKADLLNTIIDFVIYDPEIGRMQIFVSGDSHPHSPRYKKLSELFTSLNETGLNRILEYATALSSLSSCSKKYSASQKMEEDVLAAHARTDIEQTQEGVQHDIDIMNDDSEWE